MEQMSVYTIYFTYEIVEDAMKFPLQADVTVMRDNSYFIDKIRHAGKATEALIPPISLVKLKDSWVYADSKKESILSRLIGKAIDAHNERLTSS